MLSRQWYALLPIVICILASSGAVSQAEDCLDYQRYFHLVGNASATNYGYASERSGDLMYMAMGSSNHDGGLAIFDASDPENPMLLGEAPCEMPCKGITLADDLALLAANDCVGFGGLFCNGGIQTFDVSDPHNPEPLTLQMLSRRVYDIAYTNGYAIAACENQQFLVDYHDLMAPVVVDSLNLPQIDALAIYGNLLYCGSEAGDFYIVDITALPKLELLSQLPTPHPIEIMERSGDTLFLAGKVCEPVCGISMMSLTDPLRPEILTGTTIDSRPKSMTVDGDQLYLAHESGITIFDCGWSQMMSIAAVFPQLNTGGIEVTGDILCLFMNGLFTYDMGNMEFVPSLGEVSCDQLGCGVTARGD